MRRLSVLLVTALLPAFTQASVWTLEYSAELTTRHSQDYSGPETLSGTLTFDLANASDVSYLSWQSQYELDPATGATDFVTGYEPTNTGRNFDSVIFYNGDDPANTEPSADAVSVSDGYLSDGYLQQLAISVEPQNESWLDGIAPTEFEFDAEQLTGRPGRSIIYIYKEAVELDSEGNIYSGRIVDEAFYQLTSAKLTEVTTPVPEPGTLLMMLTGLFSLSIFRIRTFSGHKKFGNKKRA